MHDGQQQRNLLEGGVSSPLPNTSGKSGSSYLQGGKETNYDKQRDIPLLIRVTQQVDSGYNNYSEEPGRAAGGEKPGKGEEPLIREPP